MERIEDKSKALSYIGIEIAEALKQIPIPVKLFRICKKSKKQKEQIQQTQNQQIQEMDARKNKTRQKI